MELGAVEEFGLCNFLRAEEVGLGQSRLEIEVIEVLPVLFYF